MVSSADEEFMGSFAAIVSSLIAFYRKTYMQVYIRISEALEELDSPLPRSYTSATVANVREVSERLQAQGPDITAKELASAS